MPQLNQQDRRYLDAALRLARKHQGLTGTNPSVACIIVKDLGNGPLIIGSAVTAKGGRPHAEPPALEEAGEGAQGATAYVTLEPCSHHGKTPPCAQTLIDAGIARVVTAILDPDHRVNGLGHKMLEAANVVVTKMDGGEGVARVMQGYLKVRPDNMPFVTLKLAMTPEGLIGEKAVGNLRISGDVSNRQTHLSRARHDCILVGSNTASADDPMLTCRLAGMEGRSPVRVILDAKCTITAQYKLIGTAREVPTIVVSPATSPTQWLEMLTRNGVTHLPCELHNGRIALPELFEDLAARGIHSIMVEAGAKLSDSLLKEQLVDEIIIHVAGKPIFLRSPEDGIYAGFTPNQLPIGFEVRQELRFGDDTALRLRKISV